MQVALLLCAFLAGATAASVSDLLIDEWKLFKVKHGKNYASDIEEKFRMKIFVENRHKIAKHNVAFMRGEHSYELSLNHFGDMLHHEFVATMNGFKGKSNSSNEFVRSQTFIEPANVELPAEVDWREKGAVTAVKDQGQCGSCWAFSSTGALEGQNFRKTGILLSLSEQNLIDCSGKYGNEGCNGGLMDQAFQYVKDNAGIDTEDSYPYEGEDDKCRYKASSKGAVDTGYVDVPAGDELKLKSAVATMGPISVAIDASHESFQFYSKGVYSEPQCSSEELDHGVLVAGYGTENGRDYWLVKNSWSEKWGQAGYIKMSRNKKNQCGIASSASYPTV